MLPDDDGDGDDPLSRGVSHSQLTGSGGRVEKKVDRRKCRRDSFISIISDVYLSLRISSPTYTHFETWGYDKRFFDLQQTRKGIGRSLRNWRKCALIFYILILMPILHTTPHTKTPRRGRMCLRTEWKWFARRANNKSPGNLPCRALEIQWIWILRLDSSRLLFSLLMKWNDNQPRWFLR